MNAQRIHAAITPSASIQPEVMIANANADSLEIHLPCVHQFKPILDVKTRMIAYAVILSPVHLDIDAKTVDA